MCRGEGQWALSIEAALLIWEDFPLHYQTLNPWWYVSMIVGKRLIFSDNWSRPAEYNQIHFVAIAGPFERTKSHKGWNKTTPACVVTAFWGKKRSAFVLNTSTLFIRQISFRTVKSIHISILRIECFNSSYIIDSEINTGGAVSTWITSVPGHLDE